jgi:hypothetical protein
MNELLPITVISAIVLFLIKETVEFVKKKAAEKRKKIAFKALLADEIEKNNWAIKILRKTMTSIQEDCQTHDIFTYTTLSGQQRITFIEKGKEKDKSGSSWPIPDTHNIVFSKLISEIAVTDKKFFELCSLAYSSVAELKRIRDQLFEVANKESPDYSHDIGFLPPFADCSLKDIDDAYKNISKLYKECTGKYLESYKIRSFT